MENEKLLLVAQAVSVSEEALERSDVFLVVKFRLFDTTGNLNNQGVTPEFAMDVVAEKEKLIGLPLYCDVQRLLSRDYQSLGHMYDRQSGEFYSTQIGSMIDFELVNEGDVYAVLATARVPKRQHEICECLMQLFNSGKLKFSFEIKYDPEHTVVKDNVMYVDKYEGNTLSGAAVVSVPAFENSCALDMVAQHLPGNETEGVENEMTIEELQNALAEKDKIISEKDAAIAERDAKIAELSISEKVKDEENEDEEAVAEEEKTSEETEEEQATAAKEEEQEQEQQEQVASKEKDACAETVAEQTSVANCYEIERLQNEINTLRVELAASAAAKAELESIKAQMAAKELEANQAMAKAFAERQGLDVEQANVAKAIAEVNYKAIAEMTMAKSEVVIAENTNPVESIVGDGIEIKGGKYDDLLAPAN